MVRSLQFLMLSDCNITSSGFATLVNSPNLALLKVLLLPRNQIKSVKGAIQSEVSIKKLWKKGKLMSLELLDLRRNQLAPPYSMMFDSFLRGAVVLFWDNPVMQSANLSDVNSSFELFKASEKFHPYYDPLKIGQPSQDVLDLLACQYRM